MTTTVNPNLMEQPKYLTVQRFTEATGLSHSLVYRGIKQGTINYFQMTKNGILHIPASEVERFRGIGKCSRGRKAGQKLTPKNKITANAKSINASLPVSKLISELEEWKRFFERWDGVVKATIEILRKDS